MAEVAARRLTLKSFAKMLFTYGRGRAEQFRLHPTLGSALNFVPPLFCLFLVALPFLGRYGLVVLALYVLSVLAQVGVLFAVTKRFPIIMGAAPLIMLTHVLYGLGFWRGLFTPLKGPQQRSPVPVALQRFEK